MRRWNQKVLDLPKGLRAIKGEMRCVVGLSSVLLSPYSWLQVRWTRVTERAGEPWLSKWSGLHSPDTTSAARQPWKGCSPTPVPLSSDPYLCNKGFNPDGPEHSHSYFLTLSLRLMVCILSWEGSALRWWPHHIYSRSVSRESTF